MSKREEIITRFKNKYSNFLHFYGNLFKISDKLSVGIYEHTEDYELYWSDNIRRYDMNTGKILLKISYERIDNFEIKRSAYYIEL